MRWLSGIALTALLISSSSLCLSAASSPPINIQLRAPWEANPLLLEILEATATEEPTAFWPFLDAIARSEDHRATFSSGSASEVYHAAKALLDQEHLLRDTGKRANWEMALALHTEAPKVAAFSQVYRTAGAEQRWLESLKERGLQREDCRSWVDWSGQVICDLPTLEHAIESTAAATSSSKVNTYPFDHQSTSAVADSAQRLTAILYGQPSDANFYSLHHFLHTRAVSESPSFLRYILRWTPSQSQSSHSLSSGYLAGYGATLDLKKVDYLVIDDRKLKHASGAPSLDTQDSRRAQDQDQLDQRRWLDNQLTLQDGNAETAPLNETELATLAVKATQAILSSSDPLRTLTQLSHDFPLHAPALARGGIDLSDDLAEELNFLQTKRMRPGNGDIWLNGKPLTASELTPMGLIKTLRQERQVVQSLVSTPLKLTQEQAIDLLSNTAVGQAQGADSEGVWFFDASDRIEKARIVGQSNDDEDTPVAITWFNNVEKDPEFARYSPSLRGLLRPLYPGQFPQLRRNLFNIIFVLDLRRRESSIFLAEHIIPLIDKMPVHWGFVPGGLEEGSDSDATKIARLFWYTWSNVGKLAVAHFLGGLAESQLSTETVTLKEARQECINAIKAFNGKSTEEASAIVDRLLVTPNQQEESVRHYVQRLRVTTAEDPAGHLLVNGQHFPFIGKNIFQLIMQVVSIQTQALQYPVYQGELTDDADVSTYFYDLPTTFTSRSDLVLPPTNDDGESLGPKVTSIDLATAIEHFSDKTGVESFLWPDQTARTNATLWIVGDFDSKAGLQLLRNAVKALDKSAFRLGFVHNSKEAKLGTHSVSTLLAELIRSGKFSTLSPSKFLEIIEDPKPTSDSQRQAAQFWSESRSLALAAGMSPGSFGLIVNGRALAGINPAKVSTEDLRTLLQSERQRRIDPVVAALSQKGIKLDELSRQDAANSVALITATIASTYFRPESDESSFAQPVQPRISTFNRVADSIAGFEVGNRSTARLRVQAIMDPLSEVSQKWSAILHLLRRFDDVHIAVVLNPSRELTQMPLKKFYRHSAPRTLTFDSQGAEVAPTVSFLDMPPDAVLTMGLDAPPAWLTMASEAVYDLDNILLRDVPEDGQKAGVVAVYDLKQILIEGHAREGRNIPRGLQLVLQTPDGSETLDTIVMANLAYFQFRAKPGLYRLKIRDGKSEDVYEMLSAGVIGQPSEGRDLAIADVTLDSLDGLTIYPRFAKRPGKEDEELLEDLEGEAMLQSESSQTSMGSAKSIFDSLSKSMKQALVPVRQQKSHKKEDVADINIFTVASGHLYERMTYIMIVSVLRHTQSTVKFWFIENFLSPSFKEFIPHLAKEYGFQYELVTYAWPHWLRPQKEKQRTIWGYKILFLDVLFPLDIEKVIFVDSDQVVRTDLQELINVDLKGAPYGFPPMGDDSYDMDGYRFWKRGYWKDFLQGRPYHISALYVVDLTRFRNVAAGDRLRGQYQGLSQDPNSLANLDQDLPQTLMFHVPIHTLDQEWLWCETWCSGDWLHKAKTIDLCSNPKTHESKLDRARRQIPEWTELDEEVQALARRVGSEKEGMVELEETPKQEQERKLEGGGIHDEL